MPAAVALSVLAALAWAYLLACHGWYWRTDQRLPTLSPLPPSTPAEWPAVVVVIPARDEAAMLPATLPALLAQDYPGTLRIVLVDDDSTDGTAAIAGALGGGLREPDPGSTRRRPPPLRIVPGAPTPAGWAGKVWAMAQGVREAGEADYLLFTDADIAHDPGSVTALVRATTEHDLSLVSQMALLRTETFWERVVVPAFVYFFAQLYPFRRVNRPLARTAAAAGGCMLVRREALAAAGGLQRISAALIDDVALGRLLKSTPGTRCWLGLTTHVRSQREFPQLADLWQMVARSAYTQLRYSPALLAATMIGLLWLYALPPAAAITGLALLAAGGGAGAAWLAASGLSGWAIMTVTFLPVLRLYRLSPLRAPGLPLVALGYAAMTADSARRHYTRRDAEWRGRRVPRPARSEMAGARVPLAAVDDDIRPGDPGGAPG